MSSSCESRLSDQVVTACHRTRARFEGLGEVAQLRRRRREKKFCVKLERNKRRQTCFRSSRNSPSSFESPLWYSVGRPCSKRSERADEREPDTKTYKEREQSTKEFFKKKSWLSTRRLLLHPSLPLPRPSALPSDPATSTTQTTLLLETTLSSSDPRIRPSQFPETSLSLRRIHNDVESNRVVLSRS